MWRIVVFAVLTVGFVFSGCQRNSTTGVETNGEKQLQVSPASGYIGTRLTITGVPFSENGADIQLQFSNLSYRLAPDSLHKDTIFSHIPYGAVTGPLSITINGKLHYSIDPLRVLETCPDSVVIRPYNLNVGLLKKDAWYYDELQKPHEWQGTVSGDTVTLSRDFPFGDEGRVNQELKLRVSNASGLGCEFVAYFRTQNDYQNGTTKVDTLKKGIVKIKDFSTGGVVSGKIFYEDIEPGAVVFWYDFSTGN